MLAHEIPSYEVQLRLFERLDYRVFVAKVIIALHLNNSDHHTMDYSDPSLFSPLVRGYKHPCIHYYQSITHQPQQVLQYRVNSVDYRHDDDQSSPAATEKINKVLKQRLRYRKIPSVEKR